MLASAIIAHLSACKFLLSGEELAIARDQIRMGIGYLKSLETVWLLASKTLREVQAIARMVLVLPQQHSSLTPVQQTQCLNDGQTTLTVDTSPNERSSGLTSPSWSPDGFLTYLNMSDPLY